MSRNFDTDAEKLKPGDVVILVSGGRVWTLDERITLSLDGSTDKFRLVSMSRNGLMCEVVVGRRSIRKATREEINEVNEVYKR